MRNYIFLGLFFGLTLTACLPWNKKGNKKVENPNILFIMSDDHAYQAISAYGCGLNHTPN